MRVPVYGFPILNRVDLMKRMLSSFDHDVDRLYIVDNGGVVKPDDVKHFRANDIHIADPGFNMGVGPAWNFIIKANINADWWLIGCNDMSIQSGVIEQVVADMEAHRYQPHMCRVAMGNEGWGNHFGLFALNPEAIDTVGWFDENIYPIYFEDNDYMERMIRARGLGFTDTVIVSKTHHDGNMSWKNDPHLAVGNKRTWDINGPWYEKKWGRDTGIELETPFGVDSPDGIRYTQQVSVARMRVQDWHVARKDNVKNDGTFV